MAAPTIAGLAAQVAVLTERVAAAEAKIVANVQRIDELESRYDQIAADATATIARLEQVVEDLEVTDEMSGWKQWKEQRAETEELRRAGAEKA